MRTSRMEFAHCFPIVLILGLFVNEGDGQREAALIEQLLSKDYSREARPLLNATKSMNVSVELEITDFSGLDDIGGTLSFMGFFESLWTDELLQWNLTEFPIDYIALHAQRVWLPDFGISNSHENFYQRTFVEDYRVSLRSDGSVRWYTGTNLATTCSLDVTHFPFDRQSCSIIIQNTVYSARQVDLQLAPNPLKLHSKVINGIWVVDNSSAEKTYFDNDGLTWPRITYTLELRRKPQYYLLNILLPCILLTCVTLSMFWLPLESGERISLGITVMLSYSVIQLVLDGYLPVSSNDQAVLGVIVNIMMAVATFAVISSTVAIYIDKYYDVPMSACVRSFVFGCVARIVCMRHVVPDLTKTKSDLCKVSGSEEAIPNGKASLDEEANQPNKGSKSSKGDIEEILSHLRVVSRRFQQKEEEEKLREEWRAGLRVMECLLFWVCCLVIIITFATFFISTS